jgi:hypothetical protein
MLVHKINGAYLMYTEGTVNFFYQYFMRGIIQTDRGEKIIFYLPEPK